MGSVDTSPPEQDTVDHEEDEVVGVGWEGGDSKLSTEVVPGPDPCHHIVVTTLGEREGPEANTDSLKSSCVSSFKTKSESSSRGGKF